MGQRSTNQDAFRAFAALGTACLVLVTGCGGEDEDAATGFSDPVDTAYAFSQAAADLDGAGQCELMVGEDGTPLAGEDDAMRTCTTRFSVALVNGGRSRELAAEAERELGEIDKADLVVEVDGDEAAVEVNGEDVLMRKVDGRWYVKSRF